MKKTRGATYHHRHVTLVVKAPPIKGPTTLARPYVAPMSPLYFGRLAGDTKTAIIVYEPAKRPAAPTPHTARPIIRATELGAAPKPTSNLSFQPFQNNEEVLNLPHMRLPSSKNPIEMRYVHFSGKNVYNFPHVACVAAVVTKKAEPYQAMSSRLWNSSVILGMAVERIVFFFIVSN